MSKISTLLDSGKKLVQRNRYREAFKRVERARELLLAKILEAEALEMERDRHRAEKRNGNVHGRGI